MGVSGKHVLPGAVGWFSVLLLLLSFQVPPSAAQLPTETYSSKLRRVALADWLARRLSAEANRASAAAAGQSAGWHGAKGGDVHVDMPGVRRDWECRFKGAGVSCAF